LVKDFPGGKILVGGHGSNVSYLHDQVFHPGNVPVGYEGLVDPGGLVAVTRGGMVPLTRSRKGGKAKEKQGIIGGPTEKLVKLDRWAILFVGGKDTPTKGAPKSCFNCPHLFSQQKTCEYIGPKVTIERVKKDGKQYTPVCGYQLGGEPTVTDEPKYLGGKGPDELGLEWAEGTGTNCFGHAGGAPCEHFIHTKGEDGLCEVMKDEDNKVDSDDCCAAHLGPSITWQEAQGLLKDKTV
jgi:hypothetical protein